MKHSQITAFLGGLTCLAVAALAETTPAPGTITRGPSSAVPPAAQTGPGAVSSSVTLRSPTAASTAAKSSTNNTTNTTVMPPGTTETTTTKTTTSTNTNNPAGTVTNSAGTVVNADGTVTNADGTITRPGAQATNPISPETVAADAPRFKSLDTDGDSRISQSEFTLGAAGQLQGDTNVAATATVDNGTGVNNQVNTVQMFNQLDTNKDGFLSASELAAQHSVPPRTQ